MTSLTSVLHPAGTEINMLGYQEIYWMNIFLNLIEIYLLLNTSMPIVTSHFLKIYSSINSVNSILILLIAIHEHET